MKKDLKNAISRAIKGFEQSYHDSRFATPDCTLTAPHNRVEKLKFLKKNFEKKNEKKKTQKTQFLENQKNLSSHN